MFIKMQHPAGIKLPGNWEEEEVTSAWPKERLQSQPYS